MATAKVKNHFKLSSTETFEIITSDACSDGKEGDEEFRRTKDQLAGRRCVTRSRQFRLSGLRNEFSSQFRRAAG